MLQKFRPAQTVFESGIGLGTGQSSFFFTMRVPLFRTHTHTHTHIHSYTHKLTHTQLTHTHTHTHTLLFPFHRHNFFFYLVTHTESLQHCHSTLNITDDVIYYSTGSQAVKAKAKPGSKEYHGMILRYIPCLALFLSRIV